MRKRDLVRLVACAAMAWVPVTIAQAPPAAPLPQMAPFLVPAHAVDLMTPEGSALFGAQWKSMEGKIVEGPAIADAMPGYKTSYDIQPHAGERGFDDSSWPVIGAKGLADRRGGGRVSFLWYRANLTIPAKLGDFDTAGRLRCSRCTSTITRKSGSMGRSRAAQAIRARPRSRASTFPIASCWPIRSRRATSSRSRSSASMGRFRWHR